MKDSKSKRNYDNYFSYKKRGPKSLKREQFAMQKRPN